MRIVKVLRPFNNSPQGGLVSAGDMIEVDDFRANEMVRNGLVETAEKAAPEPETRWPRSTPTRLADPVQGSNAGGVLVWLVELRPRISIRRLPACFF